MGNLCMEQWLENEIYKNQIYWYLCQIKYLYQIKLIDLRSWINIPWNLLMLKLRLNIKQKTTLSDILL